MSELKNYFSLMKDGPDRNFCLSFLPKNIMSLTLRQREALVRRNCYRRLTTGKQGNNSPDSAEGIALLGWGRQHSGDNAFMGPTWDCGHIFTVYATLCAAVGIYTRLVAAVGPAGADDQGEYWDEEQKSWVLVLVSCNAHYVDLKTEKRMSYLSMSTAARLGNPVYQYSETGGYPIHPAFDEFRHWHLFLHDAVIGNGNSIYIGGTVEWNLFRVWPPLPGKTTVFNPDYLIENSPQNLLYPTL